MGIGSSLKKLREQKGMTLDDIHRFTKLHYSIIEALEEDRLDSISPVYIKLFIKSYCKALGVDAKEFLNSFSMSSKIKKEKPQAAPSIVEETVLKVRFPLSSFREKINLRLLGVIAAVVLGIFLVFRLGFFLAHRKKAPAKVMQQEVARAPQTAVEKKPAGNTKPAKQAAPTSEPAVIAQASTKLAGEFFVLAVKPKKKVWLKVRVDDATLFNGNLAAASVESWKARDKIEVWSSNVRDADLELNGDLLPALGKRGDRVKHILITKRGVSIIE